SGLSTFKERDRGLHFRGKEIDSRDWPLRGAVGTTHGRESLLTSVAATKPATASKSANAAAAGPSRRRNPANATAKRAVSTVIFSSVDHADLRMKTAAGVANVSTDTN